MSTIINQIYKEVTTCPKMERLQDFKSNNFENDNYNKHISLKQADTIYT